MNNKNRSSSVTSQKRTVLGVVSRIVLLTTPIWTLPVISATSATLFSSSFDNGFSGWDLQVCCKSSAQIVTSPTNANERVAKFTLRKDDSERRAEMKQDPIPANSERWYGFRVFVPLEHKKDPSYDVITQWAGRPDFDQGENWRIPVLALVTVNDRLTIGNHWDARRVTPARDGEKEKWDLGPVEKGVWTDWVFHAKWSYRSDGLLEVWRNGKLVVKKTGPNTYNDKTGPFIKMGIYKPQWQANPERSTTTQRVIYIDDVKIGDASASYQTVAYRDSK